MTTINGRACVVNGVPVDKVFSNGNQVYGRNLYIDTQNFNNTSSEWNNFGLWNKTGEKFNGLTVMSMDTDWNGLGQTIQAKKGETYTYSVYARYKSGTGNSAIYYRYDNADNTSVYKTTVTLNDTWQRVKGTVTITTDGSINVRIERTVNNENTLLIAGPKLEKGSVVTPYSLAPEDVLK